MISLLFRSRRRNGDLQFAAHLTVARVRRGGRPTVPDWRVEAEWLVDELSVVRSELHRDGAQYRIIHFATHGLVDSEHPELSAIVLSSVDRNGRTTNGNAAL